MRFDAFVHFSTRTHTHTISRMKHGWKKVFNLIKFARHPHTHTHIQSHVAGAVVETAQVELVHRSFPFGLSVDINTWSWSICDGIFSVKIDSHSSNSRPLFPFHSLAHPVGLCCCCCRWRCRWWAKILGVRLGMNSMRTFFAQFTRQRVTCRWIWLSVQTGQKTVMPPIMIRNTAKDSRKNAFYACALHTRFVFWALKCRSAKRKAETKVLKPQ